MSEEPRLYGELAAWWPLLSAPEEHAWEAALYARLLQEGAHGEVRTLLELGSGGGNNASHMKARFQEVTLVDRSPAMLDVSRRLNPECCHVEGDMRSIRLGRTFDCVLGHDAVCYLLAEEGLFPRRRWLAILEGAGFQVELREIRYPGIEEAVEAFLCRSP